ncbi:hypothetical protein BH11PLA2_BH11PLA2_25520 [soil metagenome]
MLFAIVHLSSPLIIASDSIGAIVPASVAGIKFAVHFPLEPDGGFQSIDLFEQQLLPPKCVSAIKEGGKPMKGWGRPVCFPSVEVQVTKVIAELLPGQNDVHETAAVFHKTFPTWLSRMYIFVMLMTKQFTYKYISFSDERFVDCRIEVYSHENDKYTHVPATSLGVNINVTNIKCGLTLTQLIQCCDLASGGRELLLEYSLMTEAYSSRRLREGRKAVLEAASAFEVCLTRIARQELLRIGVTFCDDLLDKYKTLGNRLELASLLSLGLPAYDYKKTVVSTRNKIVHEGYCPDAKVVNEVIHAIEAAIMALSPSFV